MADDNLVKKYENQTTPENAIDALDDLLFQLEDSEDEEEQVRIRNLLHTLRRRFSMRFADFYQMQFHLAWTIFYRGTKLLVSLRD